VTDLRRARGADAAAIAEVYLASFRAALPTVRRAHSDDEIRGWIGAHLLVETETWVAHDDEVVVGMLSLRPGWIDQLYVAPDRLGEGIGRRLLDLAKAHAATPLELWTFQVNEKARRFYERNGFISVEMTDGTGNEEREPDVRYRWDPGAESAKSTTTGAWSEGIPG
jgi:GNAT superfamily N-acetyltransferase